MNVRLVMKNVEKIFLHQPSFFKEMVTRINYTTNNKLFMFLNNACLVFARIIAYMVPCNAACKHLTVSYK